MLTVEEAAQYLRVSRKTIYRLIATGELDCIRVRGAIRIPRQAIDSYISRGGSMQYER